MCKACIISITANTETEIDLAYEGIETSLRPCHSRLLSLTEIDLAYEGIETYQQQLAPLLSSQGTEIDLAYEGIETYKLPVLVTFAFLDGN